MTFVGIDELKTHYKSELHAINSRRRCASLPAITQLQLDLARPKPVVAPIITSAPVLRPIMSDPLIKMQETFLQTRPVSPLVEVVLKEPPTYPGPNSCIFHSHNAPSFPSLRECLYHMFYSHGFVISDYEYLQEVDKYLEICWSTIHLENTCLSCLRSFSSSTSVLNHICDTSHSCPQMSDELNDCYDFTSSYPDDGDEEMMIIDSRILLVPNGKALVCRRDNLNHSMMKLDMNDRIGTRTRMEVEAEDTRNREEEKFRQFEMKFMHRHKRYVRKDTARLRFQKIC